MKLRRGRRKLLLFVISLTVIGFDAWLFVKQPWKVREDKEIVAEKPVPLNFLLNNEMSSFESTEKFDRTIERFLSKWDIKGASFAIMKDDKLLYAKGYGYTNTKTGEKCDVKHLFRVASVSKLITAVAVMKLYDSGRISLSDKVFGEGGILGDSMFLDITDKRVNEITVEHLLRHKAGFSHRIGDPMFNMDVVARKMDKNLPLSMDDMVQYAAREKLRSRPGSSSDYSNLGYLVLSKVVERVSGMKYEKYVQDSILYPIGCFDMHIGGNYETQLRPNEVAYYEVHDAEPVEAYDGSGRKVLKSNGGNNVTGLYGAGGWIASPVELLRFVTAVDGNINKSNILSKKAIDLMTEFRKSEMPIGWAKVTENDDWIRTGTLAGTSALIKRQRNNITWVFLTNTSSWKGARFTSFINKGIGDAINRVQIWPERDMFVDIPEIQRFNGLNSADSVSVYPFDLDSLSVDSVEDISYEGGGSI